MNNNQTIYPKFNECKNIIEAKQILNKLTNYEEDPSFLFHLSLAKKLKVFSFLFPLYKGDLSFNNYEAFRRNFIGSHYDIVENNNNSLTNYYKRLDKIDLFCEKIIYFNSFDVLETSVRTLNKDYISKTLNKTNFNYILDTYHFFLNNKHILQKNYDFILKNGFLKLYFTPDEALSILNSFLEKDILDKNISITNHNIKSFKI